VGRGIANGTEFFSSDEKVLKLGTRDMAQQ
jgi:hypothetical protein